MIYANRSYHVLYYADRRTGGSPVYDYLMSLPAKDRAKVMKYIEYLRTNRGILDEPYSRHIDNKIRELRVDFGRNRYRIFYFTFVNRNIVMLHAFKKHTEKTPESELAIAKIRYRNVVINMNNYAQEI